MTCLDCHTATLYPAAPEGGEEVQREGIQPGKNIQIPAELTKSQGEIASALPKVFPVTDFRETVENNEAEKMSLFH